MKITLHIPDDLAQRLGSAGELEKQLLEDLAAQAFKRGELDRTDVARLLGLSADETDTFLAARASSIPSVVRDGSVREKAEQAIKNIIARRKGVTLGGLKIKDLINDGRP